MSALRWWLGAVLLAPVWLPQAVYVRRTALRLPEASGPREGLVGTELPGPEYVLHVVGESTVAGVGVAHQNEGLVAATATALAERLGRPVRWRAFGRNGARLSLARRRMVPDAVARPADALVWVFGVNDTVGLTPLRQWRAQVREAILPCRAMNMVCLFTAVPPMQYFTVLPAPLRQILGSRARLLDDCLREEANSIGAHYCTLDLHFTADYLAADGFHPSAEGYRLWGREVARQIPF